MELLSSIIKAIGLAGGMKKMTVKALIKSAAKLAGRALGWVGLAWAVGDFVYCMNQ